MRPMKSTKEITEGHNYLNNEDDFWTMNKNRVFLKLIKKHYEFQTLLEVGCGKGTFLRKIASHQSHISCEGIDFSKEMILAAKKVCQGTTVTLHFGDFLSYHFSKKYDCIVLSGIIEHIEDDIAFLKKAQSLVNPGGRIFLLTSAHPWLYSSFDEAVHHYRRYSKKELKTKIEQTGFSLEQFFSWDILGIPYLFFAKTLKMPLQKKQLTTPIINFLLDWWFRIVENNIHFPIGLNFIVVAKI